MKSRLHFPGLPLYKNGLFIIKFKIKKTQNKKREFSKTFKFAAPPFIRKHLKSCSKILPACMSVCDVRFSRAAERMLRSSTRSVQVQGLFQGASRQESALQSLGFMHGLAFS